MEKNIQDSVETQNQLGNQVVQQPLGPTVRSVVQAVRSQIQTPQPVQNVNHAIYQ